jgi:hypothetical protein
VTIEATKASYTIRSPTAEDCPFIFATWLRGLRYGNELFGLIESDIYFEKYHEIIQKILTSPGVQVSIACLKDQPDVILGYSVFTGNRLHWVHVKSAWRNIGIARELVPSNTKLVSHVTKVGASILKAHPSVRFNPFI